MSADMVEPQDQVQDGGEGRSSRPWLAIVLAFVVVLASGGGAAWWFLLAEDGHEERDGEVVSLTPLTTTLGEKSLRHARITLAVVLHERVDPEVVPGRAPLLEDALLREVAKMDMDRLRSSEGSDALRQRLSEAAQEIWGEEVVRRVLLTELLIQ